LYDKVKRNLALMKGEEVVMPEKAPELLEPEVVESTRKEEPKEDLTQQWLDD
jgi:hypothetical protein